MLLDDSEARLNLLVSFPYWAACADVIGPNVHDIRLLVDSGAFTAWRTGKTVAFGDYCEFIGKLDVRPWRYFVLDVVHDAAATMANFQAMLKTGLRPVPIFTRGAEVAHIEQYYAASDVVGLGGLVQTERNMAFVNGMMRQHIRGRRVHWLGCVRPNFLKHYRPYMCDSSNWEGSARFGRIGLYRGHGNFVHLSRDQFRTRPDQALSDLLRSYETEPSDLASERSWRGGGAGCTPRAGTGLLRALNARSMVRFSLDCQHQLGILVFMAATTTHAVQLLIDGFRAEQRRMRKAAA